jgi:hypothetical protein
VIMFFFIRLSFISLCTHRHRSIDVGCCGDTLSVPQIEASTRHDLLLAMKICSFGRSVRVETADNSR